MDTPSIKEQILAAAERRVRAAGFADMSFRDIAEDVGIKSASVHYHFKTKADLGDALVQAYTDRFAAALAALDQSDLAAAFSGFVALYNQALVVDESVCLCAILGAEAIGLPQSVNARTQAFFALNLGWLVDLFRHHSGQDHGDLARLVVTALEGAIIVASSTRDRSVFASVANTLGDLVQRQVLAG